MSLPLHPEVSRLLFCNQSWNFFSLSLLCDMEAMIHGICLVNYCFQFTFSHVPFHLWITVHFLVCLLSGDFTCQREIGDNCHCVSGIWFVQLGMAEFFAFVSDYLGRGLMDKVLVLIGCVGEAAGDLVLHAVGQLRQTAFHLHLRQGGKQLLGLLGPRSGFLPRLSSSRPM